MSSGIAARGVKEIVSQTISTEGPQVFYGLVSVGRPHSQLDVRSRVLAGHSADRLTHRMASLPQINFNLRLDIPIRKEAIRP